ncbi:MAG: hypothetical protein JRL30_07235 [Deltaproteobacteria bacterium]|nr:hypothetical protein [Deltaproteobacteria bacterium]
MLFKCQGFAIQSGGREGKWFSGETGVTYAHESLQIHGGYGYIDEYKTSYLPGRKIMEIYEGTGEIERTIISRAILR